MEVVSVARQMVRPMLEQQLQRPVNALDGSKEKRPARSVR
jgi:hypothetical protein